MLAGEGHTQQVRCPANSAHIRQSGPDSGLGFQAKFIETFEVVPFSLGSGQEEDSETSEAGWRGGKRLHSPFALHAPIQWAV